MAEGFFIISDTPQNLYNTSSGPDGEPSLRLIAVNGPSMNIAYMHDEDCSYY